MKQTAINFAEELIEIILYYLDEDELERIKNVFDEAKEMEKEQITNAWLHGKLMHNSRIDYHEVYYNKTYKNK